jgi:hypothetical protein
VYSYFASKQGLDDTVGFSCNNIVEWCGHKKDYHKNKINEQVTSVIASLEDLSYIKVKGTISADMFSVAELDMSKFCPDTQFALIYFDEIKKIKDFKKYTKDTSKMNTAFLLLTLSYIRTNMLRRQDGYIGDKSSKPEFCYRMYIDIEKDIGLSGRYISRSVKILNELDILVSQELPRYQDDDGNWHTEVTMFVNKYRYKRNRIDKEYDYQQELQWGKEYIQEKKYLSKKFDQSTERKVK